MCPHILASTSLKLVGGRLAEVKTFWLNSGGIRPTVGEKLPALSIFIVRPADGRTKAPSTRVRFHLKTQTFCCVFMSRPHENDENFRKRSPEWKDLKTQQYRCRVDGSKLIWKAQTFENAHSIGFVWTGQIHWKLQTFENDWSCDLSRKITSVLFLLLLVSRS